jgi:hypothetical protein
MERYRALVGEGDVSKGKVKSPGYGSKRAAKSALNSSLSAPTLLGPAKELSRNQSSLHHFNSVAIPSYIHVANPHK